MNRISFLKRLLATLFGAALSPSLQANSSLRAQRGNLQESSSRYLLSATVAGTPYYDFPEVGPQLLNPVISSDSRNENRIEKSSLEHPATLQLEPTNAFDYKAIEVYWNSHKMGYIPRRHNKVLYNLMKDGAQLEANIRLVSSSDHASAWLYREPEELINIADELDAYHLRIRVYLVSENERSLLC